MKFEDQHTYPFRIFKKNVTAIITHTTSRFDLYVLMIIIIISKVNIFSDCITVCTLSQNSIIWLSFLKVYV